MILNGVLDNLRLFELKLEILTPTIITSTVGYRGFVHESLVHFIPGSILRGALLSEAIRVGSLEKEDINRLALSPDFALTPLLAIGKRGENLNHISPLKDSLVAHALSYTSKWPGEKRVKSPGAVRLKNESAWKLIRELFLKAKHGELGWGPGEGVSIEGRPVRRVNRHWEVVGTGDWTMAYVEVGIDRSRGASAPGILYAYEFLKPGCTYTGLMAVQKNSLLMKFLNEREKIKLYLGRGLSRGFGGAKLTMRKINPEEIQTNWIKNEIKSGEKVVFMALSPVFIDDGFPPIPVPPKKGDELVLDFNWYTKMLGEALNVKLKVKLVYGRKRASWVYRGWSLRTGTPKAPIKFQGMGSLLVCEATNAIPNHVALFLPVLGLGPSASFGFNQLIPLEQDPFWGEYR